jgi:predicted amino acid racemase
MTKLTELATSIETATKQSLNMISGGNSANLTWAFSGADIGRVNNLRLGESILLGRETLHRKPIINLYTDAITLVAEIIESKIKPTKPFGEIGQTAFGTKQTAKNRGTIRQAILALGIQDVDPHGLQSENGVKICGASSDHMIIESTNDNLAIGNEITFQPNYAAMLRMMTSPFIEKRLLKQSCREDCKKISLK